MRKILSLIAVSAVAAFGAWGTPSSLGATEREATRPPCDVVQVILQGGASYACYCNDGRDCVAPINVPHCGSRKICEAAQKSPSRVVLEDELLDVSNTEGTSGNIP